MVSVVRSGWAVVHSDSATEPCVHRAAAGDERLDLGDAGGGVHVQADRRRVEEPRGDLGAARSLPCCVSARRPDLLRTRSREFTMDDGRARRHGATAPLESRPDPVLCAVQRVEVRVDERAAVLVERHEGGPAGLAAGGAVIQKRLIINISYGEPRMKIRAAFK
jgi:hypothetical protein